MRRLALTSWSVHQSLAAGTLRLLDLPEQLRAAGIGVLEICHFHLPATDANYLAQLRAACAAADVELFSILIDTGDLTHPDPARRAADTQLIAGWIAVAARLGARAVRVVAGEGPPDDAAALLYAARGLATLADYGRTCGVRVLTENFRALLSTAANCNQLLDELKGAVGLCADIGNFPAESRVTQFSAVIARAESVHVKATYDPAGAILGDDVRRCLAASIAANFSGPYTLVYDRPGDSWAGIAQLKAVVEPYTESAVLNNGR